jgi:hypothetical protein
MKKQIGYNFSKKGYDFEAKPLNASTNTADVFAYWGGKIYFIGEHKGSTYSLYKVEKSKLKFCFEVHYKNIILAKYSEI